MEEEGKKRVRSSRGTAKLEKKKGEQLLQVPGTRFPKKTTPE